MPALRSFVKGAERFVKQITSAEIQDPFVGYTRRKQSGLESVPYDLYVSMPDLFSNLLETLCCNWLQSGIIPNSVNRDIMKLLWKDENKRDTINNFGPITLLGAKFNILVKVLAKMSALVIKDSVLGGAKMCHPDQVHT